MFGVPYGALAYGVDEVAISQQQVITGIARMTSIGSQIINGVARIYNLTIDIKTKPFIKVQSDFPAMAYPRKNF